MAKIKLIHKGKRRFVEVGRKRKLGLRHPCGKLEQEKPIDPKVIALRMPHRRSVPFEDRHDPRAETQIGRYLLQGEITLFEYEAGIWYRKIVNRYRRLIDAPLSSPPSLAMAKSGTEPNNEPLAEIQNEPRTPEQEYHYAKKVYDDAFEALDARGHWAAKSVARVAVHDEPCPAGYFGHLRLGLFDLALHKGLVTKRMALDNCHKIWDRYFRNM